MSNFRISLYNYYGADQGYLIFDYGHDGKVFIIDFKVFEQRKGRGSEVHKFFMEILPVIEDISIRNGLRSEKMTYIEAEIYPDGIPLSALIKFYEDRGYDIENKTWARYSLIKG